MYLCDLHKLLHTGDGTFLKTEGREVDRQVSALRRNVLIRYVP